MNADEGVDTVEGGLGAHYITRRSAMLLASLRQHIAVTEKATRRDCPRSRVALVEPK